MIWWFLILGVSTFAVVCVAIAIYIHLRRNLQKAHSAHDEIQEGGPNRQTESIKR